MKNETRVAGMVSCPPLGAVEILFHYKIIIYRKKENRNKRAKFPNQKRADQMISPFLIQA
jgi:hypothetical protein